MTVATNASTNVSRLKVFGLPFRAAYPIAAASNAPDDKVTVHPNTVGRTTETRYDQPYKTESTITANAIFLCLKKIIVDPALTNRNQIACLVSFFKKEATLPKYKNMIATPTQYKAMTFGVHIPVDKGMCEPPRIAATRIAVAVSQ